MSKKPPSGTQPHTYWPPEEATRAEATQAAVTPPSAPTFAPKPPKKEPWLSSRRARALQLAALSLAALCGGGYYAMSSAPSEARYLQAGDTLPHFTLLLAGRDVIYCYYHQPCKDQNQRKGVIQTANTDTLMLIKVDGTRVSVLSIPRDTTVGDFDPEKPPADQKVNSRYWTGGPQGLVSAVETITGERVDNYLIVRTDEVGRIIDALGGLDVDVPKGGIEWIDKAADVNLQLSEGPHHLSGKEAVWFLRVRKGFGDDYGRIDHQKQAMSQLVSKLSSPQGLSALPTILSVAGQMETNLDPAALLPTFMPYLRQFKLSFATLPTDTIPHSFNLAVNREKLAQIWGTAAQPSAGTPLQTDVTVLIEDASGTAGAGQAGAQAGTQPGLGQKLAQALELLGYHKVRLSTIAPRQEPSQVFTQSDVGAAGQLADLLGLSRLQGERFPIEDGQVGILLGGDARKVFAQLPSFAPQLSPVPELPESQLPTSKR